MTGSTTTTGEAGGLRQRREKTLSGAYDFGGLESVDLVEPARSTAYDELGDSRRALAIAVGWLEPKLG